jgi:membrane associated rhomboid family serine protease
VNETSKPRLFSILYPPLLFSVLMWSVKLIEYASGESFHQFGTFPRHSYGLFGIVLMPFLHGDFEHLLNNTLPFLMLSIGLFYFYRPIGYKIFLFNWVLSGFLVWLFAREYWHIGASSVIYGLASFIFFSGIIRNDVRLIALSLLVVFLYGSMIWGVLPILKEISWEGHLMGSVGGLFLAIYYKNHGPQPVKYEWEQEEEDDGKSNEQSLTSDNQHPTFKDQQSGNN